MFNVEPQESWTTEEADKFDQHAAARLKRMTIIAACVGAAFSVDAACVIPFLAGHSLHSHWETAGKYLLKGALVLFLLFVLRVGYVWSSWQSSREVRREYVDPL